MNSPSKFRSADNPVPPIAANWTPDQVDATLRLIAKLPAPAGLEDRIFTGVLAAPHSARVLDWPRALQARDWMRTVAAAAIVLVVGGGGWGIYSHVQQNEPVRMIAVPRVLMEQGGFSSAGVIRRPQTLNGPVLRKQTEPSQPVKNQSSKSGAMKKSSELSAISAAGHVQSGARVKPLAQHKATDAK